MDKNIFKTEDAIIDYKKEVDLIFVKDIVELEDKEARMEIWEWLKDKLEKDHDSLKEELKIRYEVGQTIGRLQGIGIAMSAAGIGYGIGYGIGVLIKYIKTK